MHRNKNYLAVVRNHINRASGNKVHLLANLALIVEVIGKLRSDGIRRDTAYLADDIFAFHQQHGFHHQRQKPRKRGAFVLEQWDSIDRSLRQT